MNPEYKYIDIVFENCDFVRIYPEDVYTFYIGEISYGLYSNGYQYNKQKNAKMVNIALYYTALETGTYFQNNGSDNDGDNGFKYHLDDFCDITHVEIQDLKGNIEYIGVPWEEFDYMHNPWQVVTYEEKYFVINIAERKPI